jgi:hypothetical protein
MERNFRSFVFIGLIFSLTVLACVGFGTSPTLAPPPTDTAIPAPTETQPPTLKASPASETVTPQCTVLQDVNLRSGPGLAFEPPIDIIHEGSVITPIRFRPVGNPGGSWIFIKASEAHQSGWITGGTDFVNCNIDLTSLPSPKPPISAQSSDAEGGCGPDQDYQCNVIVTAVSFLQFQIYQNGKELTQDDNIQQVSFSVRQGGQDGPEIYSITEGVSAYCIFGGNGPCNEWPLDENNNLVWQAGSPVMPGTYFVEILATVNKKGDIVRWAADFDVTLP